MYKRGIRPANGAQADPLATMTGSMTAKREEVVRHDGPPFPEVDQSQSKGNHIANFVQGIITASALFAGALWVIELKPSEESTMPIRVGTCDPEPESVRIDDSNDDAMAIFPVATEEHAGRLDLAMEQGNVEAAILQLPVLRYEIVVVTSPETAVKSSYGYFSRADGSRRVSMDALQVVDLR